MNNIIIRQYMDKDKQAVIKLHVKGLIETDSYISDEKARMKLDKDLLDIKKEYIENHGEFFVATNDETLIGMGALRKIDNSIAEIKRMRIDSKFQNQGIGGGLLDRLIKRAKELGYKKLILDTSTKQEAAQHVYKSRGFKLFKKGKEYGQETLYFQLIIEK